MVWLPPDVLMGFTTTVEPDEAPEVGGLIVGPPAGLAAVLLLAAVFSGFVGSGIVHAVN